VPALALPPSEVTLGSMGHVKTLSPEEKVRIRVIRKSRIRQQMLLQDDDARNSLEQKAIDERLRKIEEEKAEMDRSVPRANRDSQSHNYTFTVFAHFSQRVTREWTARTRLVFAQVLESKIEVFRSRAVFACRLKEVEARPCDVVGRKQTT
jgi:hypothetical protein